MSTTPTPTPGRMAWLRRPRMNVVTAIVGLALVILLSYGAGFNGLLSDNSWITVKIVIVALGASATIWLLTHRHYWTGLISLILLVLYVVGVHFDINLPDLSGGPVVWAIAIVILMIGVALTRWLWRKS